MNKDNVNYESIFIIQPDIGDDAIKATVEKFNALIAANGTITEFSEWGKKKLAYPIDDFTEGYYVFVTFSCKGDFPAELDRVYNITDGIIRSMIIKK